MPTTLKPKVTLSESLIRRHAGEGSFSRGKSYYEGGYVGSVVRRENTVIAEVEGTDLYRVTAVFHPDGTVQADCTCPYDWGGWCKHIVAVLLTCLHSSKDVEEKPPLDAALAPLSRDQLRTLLIRLAARNPDAGDDIDTLIPLVNAKAGRSKSQATIKPSSIQRRVRNILHSLDRMRGSDAYWKVGGVISDLRTIVNDVQEMLNNGDTDGALAALDAITEGYVSDWTVLDGSDGETGGFFFELGAVWTDALVAAGIEGKDRSSWLQKLERWQTDIEEYGVDEAFFAAMDAAEIDLVHGPIHGAMEGDHDSLNEWLRDVPFPNEVVTSVLRNLDRSGRIEEALNLASAANMETWKCEMLIRMGRIDEATEFGLERLSSLKGCLQISQALARSGAAGNALQICERGLDLPQQSSALAEWTKNEALKAGNMPLAIRASMAALKSEPSLDDYLHLQALAADQWPALRSELFGHLANCSLYPTRGAIDILLNEGLKKEALAIVKQGGGHELIGEVVDAVLDSLPNEVIPICLKEAESIINAGKSQYYVYAARWLMRAKTAYRASDDLAEWQRYFQNLVTRHGQKYRLMGLIKNL